MVTNFDQMVGCFCRLSNTHSSADWETFTADRQIYLVYTNANANISQSCIALVFILPKDSLLLVLILTKMTTKYTQDILQILILPTLERSRRVSPKFSHTDDMEGIKRDFTYDVLLALSSSINKIKLLSA